MVAVFPRDPEVVEVSKGHGEAASGSSTPDFIERAFFFLLELAHTHAKKHPQTVTRTERGGHFLHTVAD